MQQPVVRRAGSVVVLSALCLVSSCGRLIGADFDRGPADGGGDTASEKDDGSSPLSPGDGADVTANAPTPPMNDAADAQDAATDGDGPEPMNDAADAHDAPSTDGDDGPASTDDAADAHDTRDGGPDEACGECVIDEVRCADERKLERCVAQAGCGAWMPVRYCGSSEICCNDACRPIDATNCFSCGLACDQSRPVCSLDQRSCACTKSSCPAGQDCLDGTCRRSSVLPFGPASPWTASAFYGDEQTSFADVDRDGRADAIAVNAAGITVARASPTGTFVRGTWTTTGAFFGAKGTFFADVNGDGCADAIAVGDTNIIVRRSNCTDAFGASEVWGPRNESAWKTFLADANGDGCADAIDITSERVTVRRASPCPASPTTASQFGPTTEAWTDNPYYGSVETYVADVTGDGKADALVLNRNFGEGITVRRSDGARFSANERWTDDPFSGANPLLFGDVTGDGMADAVAIKADGAYMRRSNRWFFGGLEQVSAAPLSPSPNIPGLRYALVDVTADGRADLVEVRDDGVWVSVREDRRIPIRFVQLVDSVIVALPESQLQEAVSLANGVYRPAGVQFYIRSSEVVPTAALYDLTQPGSASPAALAATTPFNPACNLGSDLAGLALPEQLKTVATRCALDGEILVYVVRVGSSTALLPWEGKAFFMNPADLATGSIGTFRLAHELGHYLGLPHVFGCCGDTALSSPDLVAGSLKDPGTGGVAPLSLFWDLVYAPTGMTNLMFDSAASAAMYESELKPIQATGTTDALTRGWYCPAADASRTCSAGAQPGTICVHVSNAGGETRDYCSGEWEMQGLGLRLPDDTPTINVMSFGYAPPVSDPADVGRRQPSLSLSQIEQIHRTLKSDIDTPIRDAGGRIISGGRPDLGLSRSSDDQR